MKDFNDLSDFLKSIPHDMERGKEYMWECPLCGGEVRGVRVEYNGHLHAGCDGCGVRIMQ